MTRIAAVLVPLLAIAFASGAPAAMAAVCPAWALPTTAPTTTTTPVTTTPATTTPAVTTPVAAPLDRASALPAIAYDPRATLVGARSAVLVGSVSGSGTVTAEYWRGGATPSCTRIQSSGGIRTQFSLAGLQPSQRYRFRLVVNGADGAATSAAGTFVTLPNGVIAEGVSIGGLPFGRLAHAAALAKLNRINGAALRFTYAGAYWQVLPSKVGARVQIARTISTALDADPGRQLPAPTMSVDKSMLHAYVASLSRHWTRKSNQADVKLVGTHAVITPKQSGIAVDTARMNAEIEGQLTTGKRTLLQLAVKKTRVSAVTQAKAVVVRLGSQRLTAYLNGKPILTTPVTTGRPALPTPIGSYNVQFRASPYVFHSPWPEGSPYYYPPTPVTWAMEFYDGDFLHDDPAEPTDAFGSDSQNGYFASHGCVHVPHSVMAWLYNWLPVGAPVIVAQN